MPNTEIHMNPRGRLRKTEQPVDVDSDEFLRRSPKISAIVKGQIFPAKPALGGAPRLCPAPAVTDRWLQRVPPLGKAVSRSLAFKTEHCTAGGPRRMADQCLAAMSGQSV